MPAKLPTELKTYLAWKFDAVLPGTFRRVKKQFADFDYPILAPLPTHGAITPAKEGAGKAGPFAYFICDDVGNVRYVGKSTETHVVKRWVRPGIGGPSEYYWSNGNADGGCIVQIAKGLTAAESAFYTLQFVPVSEVGASLCHQLGVSEAGDQKSLSDHLKKAFIATLLPDWN